MCTVCYFCLQGRWSCAWPSTFATHRIESVLVRDLRRVVLWVRTAYYMWSYEDVTCGSCCCCCIIQGERLTAMALKLSWCQLTVVVMEKVMMALQKHHSCIQILPHTLLTGWKWILFKICDTIRSDTSLIWWSADTGWGHGSEVKCVIIQLVLFFFLPP